MAFSKIVPALALALALAAAQGMAQDLPPGPMRMLVGFAPGGGNDVIARTVATQFQLNTKVTIVVENKPGGGSTIATAEMARAKPDGSVLLLGSVGGQAIAPSIYSKLPYDPIKGVQPVSLVAKSANALVVNNDLPVKNVQELLAYAKANPGKLNVTSPGNGTISHLSAELFKSMAGVSITHIPYRGDAPAMQDVMAGQAQMTFASLPSAKAGADSGKVRILAVTSTKRVETMPNVPTIAESGVPGYEVVSWYGVFTTGGTPMPTVNRLAQEIAAVVAQPSIRDSIAKQGMEPSALGPVEFTQLVNRDAQKWDKVVKTVGIKLD
ncbi:Tripartite-type tricarboxylate transporter, receptor component TctC [Cupriavidus sp. OV038]|uniref:Bug family tripartite tricarboxylate transporter substrate binding protein n=1 Tax=unclassified Cupriavidus TaxID=2640874 RepID=UPI0008E4BABE|nr:MULTISPECIES: tripartite tricarboxylate transporter substrate binding protein [unclassified Cupriavidus]SFC56106.1 Tripartite-type tricarboxylate transporter, receptor component TctC [Cupriavidus sp. OV038]SFP46296.1 Tripartite-type tricarboxylate transporter, receptor component TctC [Cupriavidus sp. OV096]